MSNINSYQLFVSAKCDSCNELLNNLKTRNINIATINIDEDDYSLPFSLMIFPALVLDNKLMSYGCNDIITQLKSI